MYKFNALPIKTPMGISQNEENIPKIYIVPHKTQGSHSNLEKEEQSWRNHVT